VYCFLASGPNEHSFHVFSSRSSATIAAILSNAPPALCQEVTGAPAAVLLGWLDEIGRCDHLSAAPADFFLT
jgi:hypothetical protein